MPRTISRIFSLAALLAAAACSHDPTGSSVREIEAHEALWKQQHLSSYTFTYSVGCFCAPIVNRPATVEVRGGQVVSVVSSTGEPVTTDMLKWWPTVDAVFENLKAERRAGDSHLSVEWQDRLGYPTRVDSRRDNVADGDYEISITDVKPAP